jgi:hypothetical protein
VAFNPFAGKTVAELLVIRSKIQDEIATGSQLQSASAGDVQSSRIITEGAYGRLAKVQRALWLLNPDAYPITEIPPTRSVAVMGRGI